MRGIAWDTGLNEHKCLAYSFHLQCVSRILLWRFVLMFLLALFEIAIDLTTMKLMSLMLFHAISFSLLILA